jgi:dolichyl-diphosphooligosaccharide--protein glycosyltransferase
MNKKFNLENFKFIIPIFLIILLLFFGYNLRSGPINLDGVEDLSKRNVNSQLQNQILQDIYLKYPKLSEQDKKKLVENKLNKLITEGEIILSTGQKINYQNQIQSLKNSIINAFQTENGQTYLNAIDPYFFYGLADYSYENKITQTNFKIERLNAPKGRNTSKGFHSSLFTTIFSFNNFDENTSYSDKIASIYLIPVILVLLLIPFSYFLIRKFSCNLSAFFGTFLLISIGVFVSRTVAGFVDTDGYTVLFPLIIGTLLIYSTISKNIYKNISLGILSGFFMGLFLFAWGSGLFFFIICLVTFLGFLFLKKLHLIYSIYFNNKFKKLSFKKFFLEFKKNSMDKKNENSIFFESISLVSFLISSFIFVMLFTGKNLVSVLFSFLGASGLTNIQGLSIWPNVESSIAELNKTSLSQILSNIGLDNGGLIFIFGFMSLIFLTINNKDKLVYIFKKNYDLKKINKYLILGSIFYYIGFFLMTDVFKLNIFSQNNSILFMILVFIPLLISYLLAFFSNNLNKKVLFSIFLAGWLFVTMYLSINGVRFILLLATPISILFGIFFFYLKNFINHFFTNTDFKIDHIFVKKGFIGLISGIIIFGTLTIPIYQNNSQISQGTLPNFDDEWHNLMFKFQNETGEKAIITSWWDFGHFFSAVGKRGTTFDGGTQSGWTAHFVGKLLMEKPETSLEILRMLQCSHSRTSYDYMTQITKETDKSNGINIIYDILYKSFETSKITEKQKIIENYKYYNFTKNETNHILDLIACDKPAENYVVLSEDMVGKSGVWAHWGSWNFYKKYVYNNYKLKTETKISENLHIEKKVVETYVSELKDIENKVKFGDFNRDNLINSWFSNYPNYLNELRFSCNENNKENLIICNGGIKINKSNNFKMENPKIGKGYIFKNLNIISNDYKVKTYIQSNNSKDTELDLLLIPTGKGTYQTIGSISPLGNSLFTQGFYLQGQTLKDNFEVFDIRRNILGQKILTLKVKWN